MIKAITITIVLTQAIAQDQVIHWSVQAWVKITTECTIKQFISGQILRACTWIILEKVRQMMSQ